MDYLFLLIEKNTLGENMLGCKNQNRLLMQFHITGRCNLACKHCYRTEGNVEPLSFDDVIEVIKQFDELRVHYNKQKGIKNKGHINITGGEPLIREDIFEILDFMGENRDKFSYGILSNGTPINERMLDSLKKNRVSFVQLSIDGNKKTHDFLRTTGDYERTFKTASMLERAGIKTFISFTANKSNYKQLSAVAHKCRKCGITKLWSDRLVPIGNGSELSDLEITKEILPEYVKYLKKAQGNFLTKKFYPKTQIASERALQFLNNQDSTIYSCSAAESFLTVDEFGQIMPCRRMPIVCGNVFETTLKEVFYNNNVFNELRSTSFPKECSGCVYNMFCKGGAKCQSYAGYKNFKLADPACPLI